jgi:hypothetical protein
MGLNDPARHSAVDLARGVSRLLFNMGYNSIHEFTLRSGRRADVAGVDRKGRIVIVEIKTSVADYRADRKWQDYRDYCDHLYFAVPREFPLDLLPDDAGLIIADRFGAEEVRASPAGDRALHASRRREILIRFARTASGRLRDLTDPAPGTGLPRQRSSDAGDQD